MSSNVLLIDLPSLTHRAYFAMPSMKYNKKEVGAVFGFIRMFWKVYRNFRSKYVIGALDSLENHRKQIDASYKADRIAAPDEFYSQLPIIYEFLEIVGVNLIEVSGFEADDILGSIAYKMDGQKVIVTGDKDLFQLIRDDVLVGYYMRGKIQLCDRQWVLQKFGVYPDQFVDYLALVGDPVDNIMGVKGIGKVTASKLLQQFGNIEKILDHLRDIRPARIASCLGNSFSLLDKNKKLIKIRTDLDIDLADNITSFYIDWTKLDCFYRRFGFLSLIKEKELADQLDLL